MSAGMEQLGKIVPQPKALVDKRIGNRLRIDVVVAATDRSDTHSSAVRAREDTAR